jgi:hypothetical protein
MIADRADAEIELRYRIEQRFRREAAVSATALTAALADRDATIAALEARVGALVDICWGLGVALLVVALRRMRRGGLPRLPGHASPPAPRATGIPRRRPLRAVRRGVGRAGRLPLVRGLVLPRLPRGTGRAHPPRVRRLPGRGARGLGGRSAPGGRCAGRDGRGRRSESRGRMSTPTPALFRAEAEALRDAMRALGWDAKTLVVERADGTLLIGLNCWLSWHPSSGVFPTPTLYSARGEPLIAGQPSLPP